MKRSGFTLIELMIVVAIIAIIAAISLPNLLQSRLVANETAAIAACMAYATAQNLCIRTDYNHNGVLEYARTLNSLYETPSGKGDLALIDRSFAKAEGGPLGPATPKAGYVFAVIWAAGPNASGGARSYIDPDGHMTLGFALSAIPNQYDGVGRNRFMISDEGTVYQKDRGKTFTGHETLFDPDSTWFIVE